MIALRKIFFVFKTCIFEGKTLTRQSFPIRMLKNF